MEISVKSFTKICRICLVECADMRSLFSKTEGEERYLFEILELTANVNVQIEDNLPKQVCCECQDVMCKADAFKRRCHESEKILNNLCELAGSSVSKNETLSIIDYECSIKHEHSDLNQQLSNHDSFPPNDSTEESFDVKNDELLNVIAVYPSNDTSFSNIERNVSENCAVHVKVEAVNNYEEDTDFPSHYNDAEPTETNISEENTAKKLKTVFQCNCGLKFNTKDKYKSHTKLGNCIKKKVKQKLSKKVTVKSLLQCTDCKQEFKSLSSLKTHKQTHRNENINKKKSQKVEVFYQCLFCLCTFKTKELLAAHKHEKTDDKTELFQCSLCLRRFKNKTALSAHIQRHKETDNIKHVCKVCKREFKYKAYLENHILTLHSKKNSLSCEICGQSFTNEQMLEEHKESHVNKKKHQCSICSKLFVMSCTLKEHMRTHTGEKPFLCSQCGRGFSQKTNLAQHMRRHQGLKPFKCENCEKRFVSKGELDAHNRKHSGAHPFVCDDCGNGFTTSSALVKHRRIHTGEKPYLCDLCPMRFAASGTLKNHRRTHTGERPFQCSYCEKAFVQRNDLISHIRCHTGEKPYTCAQCGHSFRKASALKTHVKMHAKETVGSMQGVMLNGIQCAEQ